MDTTHEHVTNSLKYTTHVFNTFQNRHGFIGVSVLHRYLPCLSWVKWLVPPVPSAVGAVLSPEISKVLIFF